MYTRYYTNPEILNAANSKHELFFAPEYVDFPNANNVEFIKSLHILAKDFCSNNIKNIVGSSANSIIVLLLGLGYTLKEIKQKINDISFLKLLESTNNKYSKPLTIVVEHEKNKLGFIKRFKCLETDNFLIWAQQQVCNKLGQQHATFADLMQSAQTKLALKNIHLIGLNLINSKLVIFNYKNTPDIPIAIATRICMSFSTKFSVVEIKDLTTNQECAYTDGGIILQHFNSTFVAKLVNNLQ